MNKERRKEIRHNVDELPEALKVIYFNVGEFGEFPATTVNVSRSGMSFVSVGIFEKDIKPGQKLIINLKPGNIKLISIVIFANVNYINEIGEDLLRFGVQLVNDDSLQEYHRLLNEQKLE